MHEDRALLSADARKALPSSAFAYIDEKGERHFPIHDKAHVIAAMRLGPRSPMWSKAKGKVMAAARKFGVGTDNEDSGRSLEALFPEVRFIADRPEVRSAAEGETQHILGYAAVFGKTSRRLGGFHEQVMPGAFDETLRAIEQGKDHINVVCRYNHKDDMMLGTTMAGTLKLRVDDRGLAYDVLPPNCRADVLEYVDRGDVRYSSFAFRVAQPGVDDTWGESEFGLPMRQLRNVGLVDTAPVVDPAYHDTNAMARNISGAVASLAHYVGGDPTEVRSILEAGEARRFFHRTDRQLPVIPKPAAAQEESRVLDDPAISLRDDSRVEPEPEVGDVMVPEDERFIREWGEIRAAMKPKSTDQLCMRFHHGEPCVRPTGHPADGDNAAEGGHAGLCWGRHDGLPCNQHMGHEGMHTPITVASRDGENAEPEPEKREGEPEVPNLSGPEAMRKMMDRRKTLTALPE
jgi:uncharacterized protein